MTGDGSVLLKLGEQRREEGSFRWGDCREENKRRRFSMYRAREGDGRRTRSGSHIEAKVMVEGEMARRTKLGQLVAAEINSDRRFFLFQGKLHLEIHFLMTRRIFF